MPASASSDGPAGEAADGAAGHRGTAVTAGARAYLDHASTSPLRPAARAALVEWLSAADPGRVHTEGRMARAALEDARQQVASLLGARPRSAIFTSGATEAANAATFGALWDRPARGVLTAAVEHSCVREATERWASHVVTLPVDGEGALDPAAVTAALERDPTIGLVQCQWANHEVGTVQPVAEVAAICREHKVLLHVDAATAAGHVPIEFDELGIDLMSVSAHKMGGPAGAGALLVRRGLRVAPLILGGTQERARRGGLENVAAAAGFGAAAAEMSRPGALAAEAAAASARIGRLRRAVEAIPDCTVLGPAAPGRRVPHLLCVAVGGVEAEPVLIGLDQAGVAAHSGSSCSSEALEPSPVLEAMGVDAERSLRLSVGWSTVDADIERAERALPEVIGRLRALWAGA